MKRFFVMCGLSAAIALTGCQAVNTTEAGAVGVQRKQYMFSALSTEEINQSYAQMYRETLQEAKSKGKLDTSSAQARRLQTVGQRLIAQAPYFRADARSWQWEVNLIDSGDINANCGPGGKIIFYSGLINKLKLTDDEIAAVMGHEIAHALREHSREQMSRAYGMELAKTGVGALLGVGEGGLAMVDVAVNYGMMLPNSRSAETEADLLGIELAARAGYDPNAAISLWQKMEQAGGGAPPQFMSTHPSSTTRIQNLQQAIPRVMPIYQQSRR
ncbi:peptidase M48-like protein [Thiopseudomonas denitrificans]|uniref:Peptidase M48-like protein n=2 Tax=Thiopseudomonas denitrificans TaxID=1501432 RepID=A0A4R6TVV6_9GAMM|nr:M48 family metallopeptidase [Thiopseudomonas denitrificans]TDQ36832.1 peptidase M48-like protein [Thiopseudomonas denitrificans]